MTHGFKMLLFGWWLPLIVIIPVSGAGRLLRVNETAIWIFGTVGTLTVFVTMYAWIVFVDSVKRWPDQNALQRLINVLTFTR